MNSLSQLEIPTRSEARLAAFILEHESRIQVSGSLISIWVTVIPDKDLGLQRDLKILPPDLYNSQRKFRDIELGPDLTLLRLQLGTVQEEELASGVERWRTTKPQLEVIRDVFPDGSVEFRLFEQTKKPGVDLGWVLGLLSDAISTVFALQASQTDAAIHFGQVALLVSPDNLVPFFGGDDVESRAIKSLTSEIFKVEDRDDALERVSSWLFSKCIYFPSITRNTGINPIVSSQ